MQKTEYKDNNGNDGNMLLSAGLSRKIMEATGRFQFVKEEPEMRVSVILTQL